MPIESCRIAARLRTKDLTGYNEIVLGEKGNFEHNTYLETDVYRIEIKNLGPDLAECQIDARSGDLLFFNDLNQQCPSKDVKFPEPLITKITEHIIRTPNDAILHGVIEIEEEISEKTLYEVRWRRKGYENDYISATINPENEKIFNYVKKWSK